MAEISDGNVRGDPEKIHEASDAILLEVRRYAVEHELSMIDVFMAIHNVHKLVVIDAAISWSANGLPAHRAFRMADMTFREAMKDLWRKTA